MTQPSDGQKRQELMRALDDLETFAQYVDWLDGYQIKDFVLRLICALKG